MDRTEFERRFRETDGQLKALTDRDPVAAILAARALTPDEVLKRNSIDTIAAGTLIDAGLLARDQSAIGDGVAIVERLLKDMPHRSDLTYCLANGLSAQAQIASARRPEWYLVTRDVRRRARYLYQSAGLEESAQDDISAQSFTNLGNSLLCAYRFVEAYDAYTKALYFDPTNGVALTGAAKVLLLFVKNRTGDSNVLHAVAARYLLKARENPARIRELAGEQAYQQISGMLERDFPAGEVPDLSAASKYQHFVAKHRLALAPTIEGLDLTMQRWDSLRIGSLTEGIAAGSGVPPLFAMFNVMKSDYLVARYLAYTALQDEMPESGNYSDTLDYARYGVFPALLTVAQRACLDLLDKVAAASSEYLSLPGEPSRIKFMNRWFESLRAGESLQWQPGIRDEIARGNTALLAITEVAGDIAEGGFLQDKRSLRNTSTHRFIVLHDMGDSADRESKYIDHYKVAKFVDQLIETLRLARAVLLYFVDMVKIREHREHHGKPHGHLLVPDHDWVRGERET